MTLTQIRLLIGVVVLVGIGSAFAYMNGRIHHFHKLYDASQQEVFKRDIQIQNMTAAQDNQTGKTQKNVDKVLTIPVPVQSFIKEIREAPAKPCTPPDYPEDVKNAF